MNLRPPAPGRPAAPVPPPTLLVAAGLSFLLVVAVLLAAATGGLGDLLGEAGWWRHDAELLPALLAVPSVAGLVGGGAAALGGRGGRLLAVSALGLAVLATVVVVTELLQDRDVARTVIGALLVLAGGAVVVLAGAGPSRRWYGAGERRAAERAVARVLARPAGAGPDAVVGRGPGWVAAGAVLVVATVAGAALVVTGSAEPVTGQAFSPGDSSVPLPIEPSDPQFEFGLDQLADDCADGSLAACDDLYLQADVGSAYEEYGSTCGGRAQEELRGRCAALFD
ncbi:hypothetical protein [Geodermatophilus ruber]|uniref:Uncharacterized protein n=1 Tax=Geodermatophilus ruber TaxID=504800 RepID=A0A1I3YES7_9ACTN|nr:hypothetical protein [Geodermatophilus ruber]SFK30364.1 hypothetical protein SAMN04488085_1012 [Geodermatophilus ruber]